MKFTTIIVSVLSVSCVTAKVGTRGARKEGVSIEHAPRFLDGKNGGKNSGKNGGKSSGKNGGSNDPCSLCNSGRPDSITLRYTIPAVDSPYHAGSHSEVCGASSEYPASNTVTIGGSQMTINAGDTIILEDPDTWTLFDFETGPDCRIHSSCSVPLIGDDQIGPWVVVPPAECTSPTLPDDCLICDNNEGTKIKPPSLTFEYIGAGVNSVYQPEDKATCREGLYPENTLIKAYTKKDVEIYSGVHSTGDVFTITPGDSNTEFSAETTFTFGGSDDCFIHTSCSVPLVQNDQIGPFKVMAGNDCEPITGACIAANKDVYECGEDIAITFDYSETDAAKMGDDWVGIYPCSVTEYKHAESWLWACAEVGVGSNGRETVTVCTDAEAPDSALLNFTSPMPFYNDFGPHVFPVAPFYTDGPGSEVNTCFKAVLLREDGPSVPPYIEVCTSAPFTINAGTSQACQIRDESFAVSQAP
eukprot:CAMPEP_0119007790 /NCGR_PEP_ID=MMETSP1176-20130426/3251_1 /TAXON_ID=265551 /ORGANISM="Synedropsis recta cf, Strain CCMP1620" /LENGTH=471 /DNA_ID=CAMNT_0006960007 /DNA_START=90 /DNA_END=1505 /DNA_ORIENTATION=+